MRYELLIGWRYLRAKRKEGFISLITGISVLGLIIGVMTLNVVLAVFTGFEEDLRDRILSFNPQVVVLSFNGMVRDPQGVVERIQRVPGVVAAAPFVYGQALLTAQQKVIGAVVRAIGPESEKVMDLQRHLTAGTVADLGAPHPVAVASGETVMLPALIIGKELAQQLEVRVGDAVNVTSPLSTPSAVGVAPRIKRFVVVGLFDSGMQDYDASLVYMDLAAAQRFFELGAAVTGIEVRGTEFDHAAELAARIGQSLGFPYRVRDWMEVNHNLFAALRVGKTVYSIVLLLIVLVATFNVVSMLIMVVMEKRKDIAVLKSMGATRAAVGRIFVFKGMIIGVTGIAIGNLGAFLLCELLMRYKFIDLPKDVYAIDTLQVRMYPEYFLAVSAAAFLLCLIATVYPARQAARLAPVDVIRYE